ncbi:MAG TPA: nucleoside deaminase [Thermoanaerobaculaceae bacterium]|nr:nucleoside deaminase [Thermoanaerobaculaceae bacterium]
MELTPDWVFDARDRAAMTLALAEATTAGGAGDVPVGAVLLDASGRELARAGNRRERDGDPTAHAELLALRAAAQALGNWRLEGCTLYVTLEPCAMCAAACVQARLGCVVFAAPDPKAGFAGSLGNLLDDPRLNHRVAWRAGLAADEATSLLTEFFASRRTGNVEDGGTRAS